MIRRLVIGAWLLVGACRRDEVPPGFQGVVELDERLLSFEVGGRVVAVPVVRGQQVDLGQVLARLDDVLARSSVSAREAEAQAAAEQANLIAARGRTEEIHVLEDRLRAARADETLAEKQLTDDRVLVAKQAIPATSVDTSHTRYEGAKAARQALEEQLHQLKSGGRREAVAGARATASAAGSTAKLERDRARQFQLVAIEPGEVLDIHVEPGEVVTPGMPVLTVADTTRPYVDIFIPQQRIGGVRVGERALVRVDSLSVPLAGVVELVSRRTEFTPRYLFNEERANLVIRTRVRVADPGRQLHAGTPAFVVLGP